MASCNALTTSLSVTLLTVVVALLFAFLAAVAVSRFRFRGRTSFILTLLVIQMIPAEGLFISQYKLLEGVSLLNSVFGLTFFYVAPCCRSPSGPCAGSSTACRASSRRPR